MAGFPKYRSTMEDVLLPTILHDLVYSWSMRFTSIRGVNDTVSKWLYTYNVFRSFDRKRRSRQNRPDDKLEGTICKIGAFTKVPSVSACCFVCFLYVSGYERNVVPTRGGAGDVKSVGNEMTIRFLDAISRHGNGFIDSQLIPYRLVYRLFGVFY